MNDSGRWLSELIDGLGPAGRNRLLRVEDPQGWAAKVKIHGARTLTDAAPSDLVFCKGSTPELLDAVRQTRAMFVVAPPATLDAAPDLFPNRVAIISASPRLLMALLANGLPHADGVTAQREAIHPDAVIGAGVVLGPGVVIGRDVVLGDGCRIGPNSVLDHCTIGAGTQIGPNCSIGGEGFGYEIDEQTGEIVKFPHFGRIRIGEHVDILANVCIARGSLRDTIIGDDVKIDNLVHVAHNCQIGQGAFVIANAMLGGSVEIGHHAWIAPSSTLINGLKVGACAMTGLGAVVVKPVAVNDVVVGMPARSLRPRFEQDCPLLTRP